MAQGDRGDFDRNRSRRAVADALASRASDTNRVRNWGFDAATSLGFSPRTAKPLTGLLDFVPFVGEASGAEDTYQAAKSGNYAGAATMGAATLLGILPGVGDFAGKAVRSAADMGGGAARAAVKVGLDDPKAQDYVFGYLGRREADTPEKLKEDLRYYIKKFNRPDPVFPKSMEIDEAVIDQIPIVRRGNRYGISAAGRGGGRPSAEMAAEPIGRAPRAAWDAPDLQDYRKEAKANEVVENAYIALDTLPHARLAGGRTGYGWDELERFSDRDALPPVTVRISKNGKPSILDGNHRIQHFRDQGYDSIPAYVIRPK